ncbi:MAG: hypothetical protein ACLSCV_09210 [Acutalibacteraceae bacterium]
MHGVLAKYFDGISLKEVKTASEKDMLNMSIIWIPFIKKAMQHPPGRSKSNADYCSLRRPYHLDPEINHGIDKLIALGCLYRNRRCYQQ